MKRYWFRAFAFPAALAVSLFFQGCFEVENLTPEESFQRVIPALMAKWNIPGGSIAIARDGVIVISAAYGQADTSANIPVTTDSLFRIASISKPITATAILKLRESGLLDLNSKVFEILDDIEPLPGATVDPRLAQITILDLLRHSGGWDRSVSPDPLFRSREFAQILGVPSPPDSKGIIRVMMGVPLDFDPGTKYAYSNYGYCLLGRIIEKVTGMSYEGFVSSMILTPAGAAGMRQGHSLFEDREANEVTYYDYPGAPLAPTAFSTGPQSVPGPYGAFALEPCDSAGGWLATASDLLKFLLAVDKNPAIPDILEESTIDLMTARPPLPEYRDSSSYYALGWMVEPDGSDAKWSHTGGLPGSATLMVRMPVSQGKWRLPSFNTSWVVLFNSQPENSAFYAELEREMLRAVNRITNWPAASESSAPSIAGSSAYLKPQNAIANQPIFSPPTVTSGRIQEESPQTLVPLQSITDLSETDTPDLTLTILWLSNISAERFAFINGRKYYEGDTVEEKYPVDSIAIEGATLVVEGERAVLRLGQQGGFWGKRPHP